jgi:hypothetical protein
MYKISRKEAAWRRGAGARKRTWRRGGTHKAPCESSVRGNRTYRWRARVYPARKNELLYHSNLSSSGHRAKRAGCGRVQLRYTCFGHLLVAVRQGRQRRDAVAAGEEQIGRCTAEQSKYNRVYLSSGKLALAAMYFRRVRAIGRSFAAAPERVSTVVTPPAPAARNLGVGLKRPCRGERLAGGEQLGRLTAERSKYYRLCLYSGKLTLAAMYLRAERAIVDAWFNRTRTRTNTNSNDIEADAAGRRGVRVCSANGTCENQGAWVAKSLTYSEVLVGGAHS